MLGIPPGLQVPNVPTQIIEQAKKLHDAISHKSTAERFACVQDAVDDANRPIVEPRKHLGVSLRQLRAFLKEADPIRDWAGLTRVLAPEIEPAAAAPSVGPAGQQVLWVCRHCMLDSPAAGGASAVGGSGAAFGGPAGGSAQHTKKLEQEIERLQQENERLRQQSAGQSGAGVVPVVDFGCFSSCKPAR